MKTKINDKFIELGCGEPAIDTVENWLNGKDFKPGDEVLFIQNMNENYGQHCEGGNEHSCRAEVFDRDDVKNLMEEICLKQKTFRLSRGRSN